jgi:hypothetical protein
MWQCYFESLIETDGWTDEMTSDTILNEMVFLGLRLCRGYLHAKTGALRDARLDVRCCGRK